MPGFRRTRSRGKRAYYSLHTSNPAVMQFHTWCGGDRSGSWEGSSEKGSLVKNMFPTRKLDLTFGKQALKDFK